MKKIILITFSLLLLFSCTEFNKSIDSSSVKIDTLQGTSFLGKELIRRQVDVKLDSLQISNYLRSLDTYNSNPMNADFIIWLGRRVAYLGDYKKAINIFSEGIDKFPEDARFYRHRGHRYITTRQLDNAISDFKKAVELIEGKEDIIEPDGIPNAKNIPLSTLHNNIWYHLGLSYYLKNDLVNALKSFQSCLESSNNDDMQVATRHWLYMIFRRMQLPEEAALVLEPVHKDMTIIENEAYFNLLLFYKEEFITDEIAGNSSTGSSEAAKYGIANWHHYNGNVDKAKALYQELVNHGNWAGFGYIAAEADLSRME